MPCDESKARAPECGQPAPETQERARNNPAGYRRTPLEKHSSLDEFLAYAKGLPGMDEGWQSAEVFLGHMAQARRRIVWWNVHSNPELPMPGERAGPPRNRRILPSEKAKERHRLPMPLLRFLG